MRRTLPASDIIRRGSSLAATDRPLGQVAGSGPSRSPPRRPAPFPPARRGPARHPARPPAPFPSVRRDLRQPLERGRDGLSRVLEVFERPVQVLLVGPEVEVA